MTRRATLLAVFALCGVATPFSPSRLHRQQRTASSTACLRVAPAWQSTYDLLLSFHAEHGHADVPLKIDGAKSELGTWVYAQRRRALFNKVSAEQRELLDELGFTWKLDPALLAFGEMVEALEAYHAEHGDYQVPKKYVPNPILGLWVAYVRRDHVRAAMAPSEKAVLDGLAPPFEWESSRRCLSAWMLRRDELRECVAAGKAPPAELMSWVDAQRAARKEGRLSDTRDGYMAEELGPEWVGGS